MNIIQIDMDGNEITSSDNAIFANTKEEVKTILGSVELIGNNRILAADSKNKRVIIIDTTNDKIRWEYSSDRYIMDARSQTAIADIESNNVSIELSQEFIFVEGDGMDSSFTASIKKVDYWGNEIFSIKQIVSPKDVRFVTISKIIVSC